MTAQFFIILAFLISCKLVVDYDSSNVASQFSEHLPLNPKFGLGVVGLLGAILGVAALFMFIQKAFLGEVRHSPNNQLDDLRSHEL